MEPIEGVDYAFDRPSIAGLAQVGKRFACRYVGMGSAAKLLTTPEAQELASHGLSIVANVEGQADGMLGGRAAGREWAGRASLHTAQCGMPLDRPIYLSVDFDVRETAWPRVADALRGAADILGPGRVGIYGGYDAVAWAARDKVAHWFWQTYAWSEGRWHPLTHIRQYRNGVSLVGGTVDLNHAMVADYGQWTPGGTGPPTEGDDVDQNEKLIADTGYDNRTVGDVLGDLENMRNWWIGAPDDTEGWQAPAGSRLARVVEAASQGQPAVLLETLDIVRDLLMGLVEAPLIDAVAVAAAIASHPDIADRLAQDVARRLAVITGEVSLTGSLTAGITPPVQ